MGKYNVTHACGHSRQHSIVGAHSERDRKINWLAGQDCQDCVAAAKRNAAEAAVAGLPALAGTPKQIAWAADIRAGAVAALAEARKTVESRAQQSPDLAAAALGVITRTLNTTDSGYWIDRRGDKFDLSWVGKQIKGGQQ